MTLELADLQSGLLIADGRTLYKVSNVYDERFTATLVYPVPERTTVRAFDELDLMRFSRPGKALVQRYEEAYQNPLATHG